MKIRLSGAVLSIDKRDCPIGAPLVGLEMSYKELRALQRALGRLEIMEPRDGPRRLLLNDLGESEGPQIGA